MVSGDSQSWKQKSVDYGLDGKFIRPIYLGLGDLFARHRFEHDDLLVHVYNKIKMMDQVLERNFSLIGKLINKFHGEDVERIELYGMVLKQLYEIIGEEPPIPFDIAYSYQIPHLGVRELYNRAAEVDSTELTDGRNQIDMWRAPRGVFPWSKDPM